MPEMSPVPQTPQVDLEQEPFSKLLGQLQDAVGLTLVLQTFFQYEAHRQQNYDRRWNTNDALYFGWVPQKMWEGTNVPRSSLANKLIFDQVETALPSLMQALFGSQPDWFQIEADAGGSPEAARAVQDHLLYLWNHDPDGFGLTASSEVELAIKSMLLYGNGGLSLEWDSVNNRPVIAWVDTRDIFFDPATPVPVVDFNRAVIRRSMKTVEEIREWRKNPAMRIPDDAQLNQLGANRPFSVSDQTKEIQAALMGVNYVPGAQNFIANPASRQIEVLTYYTRTQTIVVLGREWVAFSGENPYGFIPFVFAPCYIAPGRFHALSLADVQQPNQMYVQALLNGHLDELALALHPPRALKQSTLLTPSQQRWRPGALFRVNNPAEDMQVFQPAGILTNVFGDIDYIERMAEKTSGLNALSMGTPRPGNANRTLGGMQMQAAGGNNRLMQMVKHIEDYMLVPLLYKMYRMIRVHSDFNGELPAQEGRTVRAANFFQPVKFRVLASSQLMTREKLMMILPTLVQFVIQGPLLGQLQQSGRTVDFDVFFRLVMDATGIGRQYTLIRPMNEQEQQAMQQPSPDTVAKKEQQQQAEQTRVAISREKNQTTLQVEAMKNQPQPLELQQKQMEMEFEQAKQQMAMQMEEFKIEMERQKGELKMRLEQMKMDLEYQKAQMDAQIRYQEGQQKAQISAVQGQQQLELSQAQHQTQLAQTQQQAAQQAELGETQHETAMRQAREAAAAKPKAAPGEKPEKKEKS